ncbi:PTS transporter subunit EIIB [Actinobacillus porcinus]|uniref:PTS transporter subunit EIIB n=1 Tax=Actinobacillus porcinus TaxID=51048 RepID=UPI002356A886|nr:PTS transporter subunit EIIB [Actinobacillus porcinus]MCI5764804.1 PTS transporter subunit EIIB [Actinobacillus porcinus]MDY5422410.1 PTS transporter subunit EIIB [Actinobacillus porcinus]
MSNRYTEKSHQIITALGGKENIEQVYSCATRLRVEVKNTQLVLWDQMKSVGALGIIESGMVVQAIFGAETEQYKQEMIRILAL